MWENSAFQYMNMALTVSLVIIAQLLQQGQVIWLRDIILAETL